MPVSCCRDRRSGRSLAPAGKLRFSGSGGRRTHGPADQWPTGRPMAEAVRPDAGDRAVVLLENVADGRLAEVCNEFGALMAQRLDAGGAVGQSDLAVQEARSGCDCALGRVDPWALGSVAIWLLRLKAAADLPSGLPDPFGLEIAGDWRGAAVAWERIGRPYDAALARLGSADEAGLGQALGMLDDLGARATAGAARRRMKELGPPRAAAGHPGRSGRADGPSSRRFWRCSRRACPTTRSPGGCSSPNGRLTITSLPSCPRSVFPDGGRPGGAPDGHRGLELGSAPPIT